MALARAPEGRVNLGALAADHGVTAAVYYPPMRELVTAGLAEAVDAHYAGRRRWYQRRGDPALWEAWAVLGERLSEHFDAPQGAPMSSQRGCEKVKA